MIALRQICETPTLASNTVFDFSQINIKIFIITF